MRLESSPWSKTVEDEEDPSFVLLFYIVHLTTVPAFGCFFGWQKQSQGRFIRFCRQGRSVRRRPTADGKKIEAHDGEEKTVQQIRGFRVVHAFDTLSRESRGMERSSS